MGIGIAPKPPTPSHRSVLASTLLLAGSQALGIFLAPGPRKGSFSDLRVNPGAANDTVPYIAGTPEITPHLITYFDFARKKVSNDTDNAAMMLNAGVQGLAGYLAGGGHFGGAVPDPPSAYIGLAEGTAFGLITGGMGQLRTASYRYYCGFLYGVSHGIVDACTGVMVDDRLVSNGGNAGDLFLIDDPQAWGGDHVDGGVYALAKLIPGRFWPQQAVDPYLQAQLGADTSSWSGKALFLVYGWTGFPESGHFAAIPQGAPVVRPLRLRIRRLPNNLGVPEFANVNDGDANLAECIYEWLTSPVFGVKKLTNAQIDLVSFQLAAEKLFNKNLGVTIEMNSATNVETALDTFCELGGMILYGSFNTGTIKLKVIERDYSIGSLPVFRRGPDGSNPNLYNVIRVERNTPAAWSNTANYWEFDYKDRDNRYQPTTRYVQDLANMLLTGRQRSLQQSIDGVSNGDTATFVGTREMRDGSYPYDHITLITNRDGYLREPGDAIKFIDNVDNYVKILRVGEVQKIAMDDESEIALICAEDPFGVGASAFNPFVPPGFTLNLRHLMLFEDDMNLTDGFGVQMNLPQSQGFADSFGLTDDFAFALNGAAEFGDTLNNWADAVSVNAVSLPSDDFNRADTDTGLGTSSSGHTWLTGGAGNSVWGIDTNRAKKVDGAIAAVAYIDSGVSDCTVEVTMATIDTRCGLSFRFSDNSNWWYLWWLTSTSFQVRKVEGGSSSAVFSHTQTMANGDVLKVVLSGDQIGVYINDDLKTTITDSFNQTAEGHGIYRESGGGGDPRWDDFSVTL